MVYMGRCPACQFGQHDEHVRHYRPAPPGVFGGAMCDCEGECDGNIPEDVQRIIDIGKSLPSLPDRGEKG